LCAVVLFIITLVLPKQPLNSHPPSSQRCAIKGLSAYDEQDAAIFEKLSRINQVREITELIMRREFRFGVLTGTSGAGKTSLLRAGIYPRLRNEGWKCAVLKLTGQDPLTVIKQAILNPLASTNPQLLQLRLLDFVREYHRLGLPSIVLLIDQFEQFFVTNTSRESREPFITEFRQWCQTADQLPLRVLICVKGDSLVNLETLLNDIEHVSTRYNRFVLQNFEIIEAQHVMQELAQRESIPFDYEFLPELASQLALQNDARVSPLDLQMISDTIWRIGQGERRAFTQVAFQKLGGVDGLRRAYLESALEPMPYRNWSRD
jgi:hypothetical protein